MPLALCKLDVYNKTFGLSPLLTITVGASRSMWRYFVGGCAVSLSPFLRTTVGIDNNACRRLVAVVIVTDVAIPRPFQRGYLHVTEFFPFVPMAIQLALSLTATSRQHMCCADFLAVVVITAAATNHISMLIYLKVGHPCIVSKFIYHAWFSLGRIVDATVCRYTIHDDPPIFIHIGNVLQEGAVPEFVLIIHHQVSHGPFFTVINYSKLMHTVSSLLVSLGVLVRVA
jgi:hypothetical protein